MKGPTGGHASSFLFSLFAFCFIIAFACSPAAAVISDCGFEDSEAEDGTWFGGDEYTNYTETEVFPANPGNVWTTFQGAMIESSIVHGGAQSVRLRLQDGYVRVNPAGSDGVRNVSFWYTRSNTNAWTLDVQFSIDGSIWNPTLTIPGPADADWHFVTVDINQPGDVEIRWFLTFKSTGACIFDDVVITEFTSVSATGVEDWCLYE
jgi:hypothetical protein